MRLFVTAALVLACAAGALELQWDDGSYSGTVRYSELAVLFHADDGPGDTGGRPGVVKKFIVRLVNFSEYLLPELYLYSVDGEEPGEPLDGPLSYTWLRQGEWFTFTLRQPVEVPGEFFAALRPVGALRLILDVTGEWEVNHSRFYRDGEWLDFDRDLCLRVEWEPQDTAVEGSSWGRIKAAAD